jgi:hypothetical protein
MRLRNNSKVKKFLIDLRAWYQLIYMGSDLGYVALRAPSDSKLI